MHPRNPQDPSDFSAVECLCRTTAALARPEPRHATRLLLHPRKHCAARGVHSRSRRACALMGLLQLRLWHVDVSKHHVCARSSIVLMLLQVLYHGQR